MLSSRTFRRDGRRSKYPLSVRCTRPSAPGSRHASAGLCWGRTITSAPDSLRCSFRRAAPASERPLATVIGSGSMNRSRRPGSVAAYLQIARRTYDHLVTLAWSWTRWLRPPSAVRTDGCLGPHQLPAVRTLSRSTRFYLFLIRRPCEGDIGEPEEPEDQPYQGPGARAPALARPNPRAYESAKDPHHGDSDERASTRTSPFRQLAAEFCPVQSAESSAVPPATSILWKLSTHSSGLSTLPPMRHQTRGRWETWWREHHEGAPAPKVRDGSDVWPGDAR
jgi:hypothetical protein